MEATLSRSTPRFSILVTNHDGSNPEQHEASRAELAQANPDDDELLAWLESAAVGAAYYAGGGAAPLFTVRRLA